MISAEWRGELYAFLSGVARTLDVDPVAIGGTEDHVHLLLSLRATHRVADVVRELKKVSSVWAQERLAIFAWQSGYAAFTLRAADVATTTLYIHRQEEHHHHRTSADELRDLLAEFGVPFEERFFE